MWHLARNRCQQAGKHQWQASPPPSHNQEERRAGNKVRPSSKLPSFPSRKGAALEGNTQVLPPLPSGRADVHPVSVPQWRPRGDHKSIPSGLTNPVNNLSFMHAFTYSLRISRRSPVGLAPFSPSPAAGCLQLSPSLDTPCPWLEV